MAHHAIARPAPCRRRRADAVRRHRRRIRGDARARRSQRGAVVRVERFGSRRARIAARGDARAGDRRERRDGLRDPQGGRARRGGDPAARHRAQRAAAGGRARRTSASRTGAASSSPRASSAGAIAFPTSPRRDRSRDWLARVAAARASCSLPDARRSLAPSRRRRRRSRSLIGPEGGFTRARSRRRARGIRTRCASGRACCAPRRRPPRRWPRAGAVGRFAMRRCARSSLVLAASLAGCAAPPRDAEPCAADALRVRRAGRGRRAVARVITSRRDVPGDRTRRRRAYAMDVRARPGDDAAAADASARRRHRSRRRFPCSSARQRFPPGVARASIAGRALPLPKANPQRIVVIGDTGCRIKTADNVFQACNDAAQWPFAAVADAAAASAPDLVIHVGDYHYRENACPPGNAGCAGSPWGYGWDAWEADFFAPAREAPRRGAVDRRARQSRVVRRAGQGWWRFLDPRPLAARQDCNDPADDAIGDYSEPYAVPLGAGARHAVHRVRFVAGRRRAAAADDRDVRRTTARSSSARSRSPRGGRTRSS